MKTTFLSSASRTELCGVPLPPRQAGVRFPCQERIPVSGFAVPQDHTLLRRLVALLLGAAAAAVMVNVVENTLLRPQSSAASAPAAQGGSGGVPVIVYERMMDADVGLMEKVQQGVPEFFLATGVLGRPDQSGETSR